MDVNPAVITGIFTGMSVTAMASAKRASHKKKAKVKKYQIALSYSNEDREYVSAVADHLRASGIQIYDGNDRSLRGFRVSIDPYLAAECVVVFISGNSSKSRRIRGMVNAIRPIDSIVIVPVSIDNSKSDLVKLRSSSIDASDSSPSEVGEMLVGIANQHVNNLGAGEPIG